MKMMALSLLICHLSFSSVAAQQKREFRGAWIQCVNGQFQGLSTQAMQQTLTYQLNELQKDGVNAIIFQVRPECDALYQSSIEPWSRFLTGQQGKAPSPYWDPLQWMIEQCHARGMELHAWINPYRAKTKGTSALSTQHIAVRHPERCFDYDGLKILNPGIPANSDYICEVARDIVSRYDVDGIHMDDYFYPYPVGGQPLPDKKTFERYPRGFDNLADWRRDNVNLAIQAISETIRECRDDVEFGISPFGVWRNASVDSTGSATRAGITNYDDLYADIRLWIKEGWIDYVLPQLYWEIGKPVADYEVLAHWWANEVRGTSCKLYVGMAPYKLEEAKAKAKANAWNTGNEIARQMRLNRTIPEISGECFYSTRPLLKNPRHVCDSIRAIYAEDDFTLPWE
jgi:uncharacterized lipoprotein YddW (UPF0748 family)